MVVQIKLSPTDGSSVGPSFDIAANNGASISPSSATLSELIAGKNFTVSDAATEVTVISTGSCLNSVVFPIQLIPPPVANKIVVSLTGGADLFGSDSLDDVIAFLTAHVFTAPVTVKFYTSDTFIVNNWNINYNNGNHALEFVNTPGVTPVIDGNFQNKTVVVMGVSNMVWDGINVINGITQDEEDGGTIVRLAGNQSNVTIKNCTIAMGYVGIRGTTNLTDILIDNVRIESVNAGSIRLGTGSFSNPDMYEDFDLRTSADYDMHNIIIRNSFFLDTLNGGNVPGTTGKFSPLVLLKMCEGVTVDNTFHSGNGACIIVETSVNIVINACEAVNLNSYGVSVTQSDVLRVSNCGLKEALGTGYTIIYIDTVRNFEFLNNSILMQSQFGAMNIRLMRRVLKFVGNAIKTDYETPLTWSITQFVNSTPYVGTVAEDFQEEHDNLLANNNEYVDIINIAKILPEGQDLRVRPTGGSGSLTWAEYQTAYPGYGVNDFIVRDNSTVFTSRTNPGGGQSKAVYIPLGDPGSQAIASQLVPSMVKDCDGYTRVYPTDIGAFDRGAYIL